MSRTLASGLATAVAAETGQYVHLIELRFGGGTVNYATGTQAVTASLTGASATSWVALGGVLDIGAVDESTDSSGAGVDLTLSGVDQTVLNLLLADTYLGRLAKVWLAHIASDGTIVSDPLLIFSGRMNGRITVRESRDVTRPGTVVMTVRIQDRLGDLDAIRGMTTNLESHQAVTGYTSDLFYSLAPYLATKRLSWGAFIVRWGGAGATSQVGRSRGDWGNRR